MRFRISWSSLNGDLINIPWRVQTPQAYLEIVRLAPAVEQKGLIHKCSRNGSSCTGEALDLHRYLSREFRPVADELNQQGAFSAARFRRFGATESGRDR